MAKKKRKSSGFELDLLAEGKDSVINNKGISLYNGEAILGGGYVRPRYACAVKNGVITISGDQYVLNAGDGETMLSELPENKSPFVFDMCAGVYLTNKKAILINGDSNYQPFNKKPACTDLASLGTDFKELFRNIQNIEQFPTISFMCASRFYRGNSKAKVIQRFGNGELEVLDFTKDQYIPLTKSEKTKKNKHIVIKPPEKGYTLLANRWHKAGSILVHDTESEQYFLFGRDDGSYFGVELPSPCKTVKEAETVLIPKEVQGKKYVRQGEWFVVKVDEKEVPPIHKCIATAGEWVTLNKESEESNDHTIHSFDIRIADKIYANGPKLMHDEHPDVEVVGWHTFYRNTALRSFSQEGVD